MLLILGMSVKAHTALSHLGCVLSLAINLVVDYVLLVPVDVDYAV